MITTSEIIKFLITFILGGGITTLLTLYLKNKLETRAADREDRAEPIVLGKGVIELTDALQAAAHRSVELAQADLVRAREALEQTQNLMEQREVEHEAELARRDAEFHTVVAQNKVLVGQNRLLTEHVRRLVEWIKTHYQPKPGDEPVPDLIIVSDEPT